jgi:lysophospholipase L1-like esterase
MRRGFHLLLLLALLGACAHAPAPPSSPIAGPYAAELARFDSADRVHLPAPHEVLFVGSSSIRMWTTLAADFPGVPVINRGFGGSELSDVVAFADRIVVPYRPRLIVLYAGDNDLAAGKTPATVLAELRSFVAIVHRDLPGTPIAFIAVKPSIARQAILDRFRETNRLVRLYAATDPSLRFVDVFTPMLDSLGQPRRDLFLEDGLHMNAAGYAIWRDLLTPVVSAGRE